MPPGIYGDAIGRAEYSLRRRCTSLSFTAGILDTEDPESVGKFTVWGDGRKLRSFSARYGQATPRVVAVTHVLRLKLEATAMSSNGFRVAYGSPKVDCTGSF